MELLKQRQTGLKFKKKKNNTNNKNKDVSLEANHD